MSAPCIEVPKTQSLMEKYNIPVQHLDFGYIKQCVNAKTLEKIIMVLKSGEEGFYPDLTRYALKRLESLKPYSKAFLEVDSILTRYSMATDEWIELNKSLNSWVVNTKQREITLKKSRKDDKPLGFTTPIRSESISEISSECDNENKLKKIASTDYAKWDKFDADIEVLKMELVEERHREQAVISSKTKTAKRMPISSDLLNQMSDIEKEELANRYKTNGNDYFQSGDYDDALYEYTQSILLLKSASAYNNRALIYLKFNENAKAIADCDQCLNLQPNNVKALLRKAQAYMNEEKRRNAYHIYCKVLSISPDNSIASKHVADLQKKLPDLPPMSALRILIEEEVDEVSKLVVETKPTLVTSMYSIDNDGKNNSKEKASVDRSSPDEVDFAKLIVPNKIVNNKLKTAANAIKGIKYKK